MKRYQIFVCAGLFFSFFCAAPISVFSLGYAGVVNQLTVQGLSLFLEVVCIAVLIVCACRVLFSSSVFLFNYSPLTRAKALFFDGLTHEGSVMLFNALHRLVFGASCVFGIIASSLLANQFALALGSDALGFIYLSCSTLLYGVYAACLTLLGLANLAPGASSHLPVETSLFAVLVAFHTALVVVSVLNVASHNLWSCAAVIFHVLALRHFLGLSRAVVFIVIGSDSLAGNAERTALLQPHNSHTCAPVPKMLLFTVWFTCAGLGLCQIGLQFFALSNVSCAVSLVRHAFIFTCAVVCGILVSASNQCSFLQPQSQPGSISKRIAVDLVTCLFLALAVCTLAVIGVVFDYGRSGSLVCIAARCFEGVAALLAVILHFLSLQAQRGTRLLWQGVSLCNASFCFVYAVILLAQEIGTSTTNVRSFLIWTLALPLYVIILISVIMLIADNLRFTRVRQDQFIVENFECDGCES